MKYGGKLVIHVSRQQVIFDCFALFGAVVSEPNGRTQREDINNFLFSLLLE